MKNKLNLLFVFIFTITSCAKKITKTCTCKDPWGGTRFREVFETTDKKESEYYENECITKSNTFSNSGTNIPTTSTVVPCEIS